MTNISNTLVPKVVTRVWAVPNAAVIEVMPRAVFTNMAFIVLMPGPVFTKGGLRERA